MEDEAFPASQAVRTSWSHWASISTWAPDSISRCIAEAGVGFMFAPNHHPAMKRGADPQGAWRADDFQHWGPLTNPASAPNILMGVFHPDLVGIQVRALQRLGAEHALVVYGRDGMDEISLGSSTLVGELKNGQITEYEIHPEDFGLAMASNRTLKVDTPVQSMAMLLGVLNMQPGAAQGYCCAECRRHALRSQCGGFDPVWY